MKSIFAIITFFIFCVNGSFSQNKMLYVIDSIPIIHDPEEWNVLKAQDIADMYVITNKDSLSMLGWGQMEGITYIFTKGYRSRPDSLRAIPGLKQMQMKDGGWHLHDKLYNGRYIDYFYSGSMQNEGWLLDGKLHGWLIVYFKNGNKKSEARYFNGKLQGDWLDYYKNGTLMQVRSFLDNRQSGTTKTYFFNGKLAHEIRPANLTSYDTLFDYYSTGKIRKLKIARSGVFYQTEREADMAYYNNEFYNNIAAGDMKKANRTLFKLWKMDSSSIDLYFREGYVLSAEMRFDLAIEKFNQALSIEPLMRESLVHRGIARIKKYKYKTGKQAHRGNTSFSVADLPLLPEKELLQVCHDFLLADELDQADYFVRKQVSEAVLEFCRQKIGPFKY